jgi:hypothetical protein
MTALQSGSISVPNNALYGPLQFSAKSNAGLIAVQYFKWDSASKTAVAYGPPTSLTLK